MFKLIKKLNTIAPQDVFTPCQPAKLNYIQRPLLEAQVAQEFLVPGMQLILTGSRGWGKTTLVEYMLEQQQVLCIRSQCTKDSSFESVLIEAYRQYYRWLDRTQPFLCRLRGWLAPRRSSLHRELRASCMEYKNIGDALPEPITIQRLGILLGQCRGIWLIDDLDEAGRACRMRLLQALKVFADLANRFKDTRIIITSSRSLAPEMLFYSAHMMGRTAEIPVAPFTKAELHAIVQQGLRHLGVPLSRRLCDEIVQASGASAAKCHHICYTLLADNPAAHGRLPNEEQLRELLSVAAAVNKKMQRRSHSANPT